MQITIAPNLAARLHGRVGGAARRVRIIIFVLLLCAGAAYNRGLLLYARHAVVGIEGSGDSLPRLSEEALEDRRLRTYRLSKNLGSVFTTHKNVSVKIK